MAKNDSSIRSQIKADRERASLLAAKKLSESKYQTLLTHVDYLEKRLEAATAIKKVHSSFAIVPKTHGVGSEATAVALVSDWHIEETVNPETVNGLNEYNLDIARARAVKQFTGIHRLWQILKRDIPIPNIVLALLGDFISGNIHDELLETCSLRPMDAILFAQELLESGISFLLKNTNCKLIIPCTVGNHGRITAKSRVATEKGNSLESLLYASLAKRFAGNSRVTFQIAGGYLTYLDVYGMKLRFHHGHNIRYQGGVGGLTIPLNKAIDKWNTATKADIDLCGHWHQCLDGGNFIVNGSLIGYNAYSVRIKGSFERPKQSFLLIDKKRGKTVVCPVLVD